MTPTSVWRVVWWVCDNACNPFVGLPAEYNNLNRVNRRDFTPCVDRTTTRREEGANHGSCHMGSFVICGRRGGGLFAVDAHSGLCGIVRVGIGRRLRRRGIDNPGFGIISDGCWVANDAYRNGPRCRGPIPNGHFQAHSPTLTAIIESAQSRSPKVPSLGVVF